MKVLIIGGSGFIGRYVTTQLVARGEEVINFHRGETPSDPSTGIRDINGNRSELNSFREEFRKMHPEVVVDMIAMCETDAQSLVNTFRGITQRLVVISSADVYRNYELLRGIAEAVPDPNPLTESSPLRENLFPYRSQAKNEDDRSYNYDKILMERIVMNDPELPATVLRLPAIYGPGDQKRRLFHYLKRMDDGRPAILVETEMMNWRWTRGYVENVAAAISWAAGDQNSTSRIYNVGESRGLPEKDWIAEIAGVVGWRGRVVPVEPSELPNQMRSGLCWQHHLETDTSRIRAEKGFSEPISFRDGVRRTIEWERANPPDARPGDFDYESEDRVLKVLGFH
jgi:nucleoside-diphosphate-sugar epimerase